MSAAAPKSGAGLYAGLAGHTSKGRFTRGPTAGEGFKIDSAGISVGVDYQFVFRERYSVNLFFLSSAQRAYDNAFEADLAGHGIIGVQGRYWWEGFYIGLQAGRYTEVLTGEDDKTDTGAGYGAGIGAGWKADNGFFVSGQYDGATLEYDNAKGDLRGLRLHLGYRW